MKKKIIAGICIVLGIAIMVVPFYYHFHGQQETDKLMEQFEQSLEDDEDEKAPALVKRMQPYFPSRRSLVLSKLKV